MSTDAHICIITGSHLCRNPRVVKEAGALSEAGYDVTVLGPVLAGSFRAEDEQLLLDADWNHCVSVDLRSTVSSTWARLRRRAGTELTRRGWERADALGYGVQPTLRQARRMCADLYIGHEEVGTWVVWQLEKEGARVGVDFEDWHTRDLLPDDRAGRPVALLEEVEQRLLQATHVTTTSDAMAQAMADAYRASKPTVIYNAFPWSDREGIDESCSDRDGSGRPSVHWVSQTIGPGRGLEALCSALRAVETPLQVHLRGQCRGEYQSHLRQCFPGEKGHALHLHGLVSPDELLNRVAEHDIGLALEPRAPDNKLYTVSNKILHYLLGGLAVVATDTAGQQEVAEEAGTAVRLCTPGDEDGLSRQLRHFLVSEASLETAQDDALQAARDTFCWERQVPRLVASVRKALS